MSMKEQRTGRLLAEIVAWIFLITVALVLLFLLLWTYGGIWTVLTFFPGAINPLILIFVIAIVGSVVFFLVKQGKSRRWFVIGLFALVFVCLGVVVTQFELNKSRYKKEMIGRFAFDPDVRPQKECVRGRDSDFQYLGEWKFRKNYLYAVTGIPHGVSISEMDFSSA